MKHDSLPRGVLKKLLELSEHAQALEQEATDANRALTSLRSRLSTATDWRDADERAQAAVEFERLNRELPRLRSRSQSEARVLSNCKAWIASLPHSAKLEPVVTVIDGCDLVSIRKRITLIAAERRLLELAPTPSADLKDRISDFVDELARSGQPAFHRGIAGGQLDVRFSGGLGANRLNLSGFDQGRGDGLVLIAWLFRDQLKAALCAEADRLAQDPLPPAERPERLRALAAEEAQLRYREEALVCRQLGDRDEQVARDVSAPPAFVLGVRLLLPEVEREVA